MQDFVHVLVEIGISRHYATSQNPGSERDACDNNASNKECTALFQLGSDERSQNPANHHEAEYCSANHVAVTQQPIRSFQSEQLINNQSEGYETAIGQKQYKYRCHTEIIIIHREIVVRVPSLQVSLKLRLRVEL